MNSSNQTITCNRVDQAAHPAKSGLALRVHQRLCENFHPPFVHPNDRLGPLSQLIYALIARGTQEAVADSAFRRLTAEYWSWSEVRDERRWLIESLIADTAFADQKAACIVEALTQISGCSSWREPSLRFLEPMTDAEALACLQTFSGVSPRVSRSVLLFSTLRRAVLPLDSHGFRSAARLGIIDQEADEDAVHTQARAQLPPEWSASDCERHYFAMRSLGQNYCTPRRPRCEVCPVRLLCRFAQAQVPKRVNLPYSQPIAAECTP